MPLEVGIKIVADLQELSGVAAKHFARLATEAVLEKARFTVALSGGSTPESFYRLLANENEPYRAQVRWENIHFFWGDERHVPPDHPDSNYRMANETMLRKLPVPMENVHRIRSELTDAHKAADEYEQTLCEFFKLVGGQYPRFDLVLLGLGSDGHTASIFPNSDVVNERVRLVVATWIENFESYRITLTPPVLESAAAVDFLVSGAEKANALREVLKGDYHPELSPAQLLRRTRANVLWLVDRPAARHISTSDKDEG
ncbi:MAG TPA: 6-phosphogluconolactonase [Pyrinomonadaceae bacterium]|nr:6-phosphogluconolactonase [Pyrinomonadaceae bacterium]